MSLLARRTTETLLNKLDGIHSGRLELTTPDGKTRIFEGREPGHFARIELRDWRVMSNFAMKGDIGFAEDYRAGNWETDNIQNLVELALRNHQAFDQFILGKKFSRTLSMLSYLLRLNSLKGSRQNIHAHYDLGNDFYKLWLDPSMTYSAALYKDGSENLQTAQDQKYDRILDCLESKSGDILEIGCGWGGFAERAASRGDFALKGITLSEEQHAYAQTRLGNRADIVLEDYRHQSKKHDHIVSIEMFEAVGERYWPTYFEKIGSLLKDKGKAVIQTITIRDQDFERYRRGGDFIRSFIFPGGMLPSPSKFREQTEKAGLRCNNEFFFGQDYARTLDEWLKTFDAKKEEIKTLGFDDGFLRLWRFYLAACAGGFRTGRTDVMQVELSHA